MDATAVTRLENNQREPRLSEGIALSRFLGFDLFLYAPAGFSYAGLVADTVASYGRAASALAELMADASKALGMQNYLEHDEPLTESELLANLLAEIKTRTEIDGELYVDGHPISALLDSMTNEERVSARALILYLLQKLNGPDADDFDALLRATADGDATAP